MTVKEIMEMYPDAADTEFYTFTSKRQQVHSDFIRFLDERPPEGTPVADYELMDEEDYHNSVEANSGIETDFEEEYGNKQAKVLVIILAEGWDKESEVEEVTPVKLEMAETLVSLPGWDGLKDPVQLCRIKTGEELQDALEAYNIEFSGIEYEGTGLELSKMQEKKIIDAHDRYDKANTIRVSCKFNKNTDKAILEWLAKKENKQKAVKDAILYMIRSGL